MGEVYEAEHVEHERVVALKVLATGIGGPDDRARFLREGRLAASVRHPNTVFVFGSEEIEGSPTIAMELVRGGTLKDRILREGALPPSEAVDAILEVVAGLEAAHAAGILHRDIKPGHCFVDVDGVVKVGDFGLSISDGVRNVGDSARIGHFLGTPEFASPEQVRGEPLDVRSDIYAVGATLYALVTAQPPLEGRTLEELFSRITSQSPTGPGDTGRAIPAGLDAVVLRCLAKDVAERPSSYAELAELLQPFGSRAPEPSHPAARVAAGVIDVALLRFATGLLGLLDFLVLREPGQSSGNWTIVAAIVGAFLYYSLTEWRAGASPGKWVMGLRVLRDDGQRIQAGAAFARAAIFVIAVCVLPGFLNSAVVSMMPAAFRPSPPLIPMPARPIPVDTGFGFPLMLLALFSAARRGNAWAGLHDRWTGTRVMKARPRVDGPRPGTPAEVPVLGAQTFGPYRLLAEQPQWLPLGVVGAYDEMLRRPVWIAHGPAAPPAPDAARRSLFRPGRLRWLTAGRANDHWDAFEAVEGAPMLQAADGGRPWSVVRRWLLDLAVELRSGLDDGSLPPLQPERVWITREGRALLLDWPVMLKGTSSTEHERLGEPTENDARTFLLAVAEKGLVSLPPPPLEAARFLAALRNDLAGSPSEWIAALKKLSNLSSTVSRWRRAAHLGGLSLFAVGGAATFVVVPLRSLGHGTVRLDLSLFMALGMLTVFLLPCAVAGIVSALLFRSGLGLRLSGIAIVRPDGREASRARAALRALVAWAPACAFIWVMSHGKGAGVFGEFGVSDRTAITWQEWTVRLSLLALFVLGAACAVRRPERGWQDWIAGTWLVPR